MKVFCVHPSPLMYTKVFLRLEPLGLELVAQSLRRAGHEIRLMDLQVESRGDFFRELDSWRPDAICFSLNYLANVPEVVDLAKAAKTRLPGCFTFIGGHSASFVAKALLEHGEGLVDCVLRGEGEAAAPKLLEALTNGDEVTAVPGALTLSGEGPAPGFIESLDEHLPARDLLKYRRKYFLGTLDPCASIEFSRGCPWDCSFCSAWTFYGRSYRLMSTERILEDLRRIREAGIFIVDDVAFIHAERGMEIGEAIAREGIRKQYYLETRGDVLLRNKEVFKLWKKLGMEYMFLGLESIDAEGLQRYRKRVSLGKNFEALEFARSLGITVAINLIADPDWDKARFEVIRQWCMEIPEIVNISVNTPYPGTESWHTEARQLTSRDYRLFDIQHAVLPTKLPLDEFYGELVKTQRVLYKKHMGWAAARDTLKILGGHLLRGQTNFLRSLWKFNSVFNPDLQLADHRQPVKYEIPLPSPVKEARIDAKVLYIHKNLGRNARSLDDATERFVDDGRMGLPGAAN